MLELKTLGNAREMLEQLANAGSNIQIFLEKKFSRKDGFVLYLPEDIRNIRVISLESTDTMPPKGTSRWVYIAPYTEKLRITYFYHNSRKKQGAPDIVSFAGVSERIHVGLSTGVSYEIYLNINDVLVTHGIKERFMSEGEIFKVSDFFD